MDMLILPLDSSDRMWFVYFTQSFSLNEFYLVLLAPKFYSVIPLQQWVTFFEELTSFPDTRKWSHLPYLFSMLLYTGYFKGFLISQEMYSLHKSGGGCMHVYTCVFKTWRPRRKMRTIQCQGTSSVQNSVSSLFSSVKCEFIEANKVLGI